MNYYTLGWAGHYTEDVIVSPYCIINQKENIFNVERV